ncbi:carbohydrate kinase family protein [Gordonia sp. (in: high G+C Gram-positive bacteria)]|uniref:carbohydrate kinase family protein n=1 Tax=Gordonia sp. (in: high G+C Gram-positive bacteria) TaxID=84139 RepID=UPI001DD599E0|nr:PfkB family carbohydrate kinase [Gordonia sp. (in: high G+C Gram-positive bacteria)]MCB1293313.1 carbohydrate kinase family protein [Gordonia sp. (in: high G+C Gram-positive bacteria)]HMS75500.1 PfkB family carbohydrate kinase [Gordonia sp. (in: high G+C Gram-positive bacteria)]HQV18379.1 PfkB family carbohydrate kinase [Gordonia sp. (in: high G+C Gram-positive bacteria)]
MTTASTPRKVAVLGPIPRDHIVTHRGEVFDKYGCALYTVAALSSLLGPDDVVRPIVHVRRDDLDAIHEKLAPFGNVDLTGIRADSDRGDVVELTFRDQNFRDERQTGFMHPIQPQDVEFALDSDAFVCVPITDYEVAQPTLAYIRANSDATIMLDCHGPTVALTAAGQRVSRLWIDRDAWLPTIDIMKMNLEEAGCAWFPPPGGDPDLLGAPLPREQLPEFAQHCLDRGVTSVCVTLDEEGCALYFRGESGELREELVPRIEVTDVVDTTGCGDSFAAGMAYGYLVSGDLVTAARYGNAMGAQRCSGSDLSVYLPLEGTDAQIAAAYGLSAASS